MNTEQRDQINQKEAQRFVAMCSVYNEYIKQLMELAPIYASYLFNNELYDRNYMETQKTRALEHERHMLHLLKVSRNQCIILEEFISSHPIGVRGSNGWKGYNNEK